MTSKREKLQYAYVFFADLLTMAVSVLLAWLITDGLFGVLIPYTSTDWLQTLCLLFVAFVVTFFFFDQDKNIVTQSQNEEISLSIRFNIAFGLVYAGCMLLAKATMLDSRYFAVTVPAVNAVLLPFSHAILKRLLIRFQRSWGMETLVGVVTTSDRAERLIPEIRKDWSRRVVGVSLLEATPASISTKVCGVEVKATFDDFMDWIRREALDEVYVDVPMDSGESFIPYLDEMESMGLTVHFRLLLLDRIAAPVALVVCLTLICTILLSQIIGGILPVAAEKLHVDPAVMASPLFTPIVDTTTLRIYFNIAKMLLHL